MCPLLGAGIFLPVSWEWKNLSRELWLCPCWDGAAGAELAPRGRLWWPQPPAPVLALLSQGDTGACRVPRGQHPPKPRTPQSPGTVEQGRGGRETAPHKALGGTTRDVTSVTPRSSGRALRRCQAGTGHWAASEVQGRTGTAGDVLGARQHAEPQRGRTEHRRLCAARRWLGRVLGCPEVGCRTLVAARCPAAQHLQLPDGVCSKRAAMPAVTSRGDGCEPGIAAPLGGLEVWSGAGAKPELLLPAGAAWPRCSGCANTGALGLSAAKADERELQFAGAADRQPDQGGRQRSWSSAQRPSPAPARLRPQLSFGAYPCPVALPLPECSCALHECWGPPGCSRSLPAAAGGSLLPLPLTSGRMDSPTDTPGTELAAAAGRWGASCPVPVPAAPSPKLC